MTAPSTYIDTISADLLKAFRAGDGDAAVAVLDRVAADGYPQVAVQIREFFIRLGMALLAGRTEGPR